VIIVLMGVTGAGKTTVGRLLADDLGWRYFDADDFHSPENIEKMRRGVALDDRDRQPWLDSLRTVMREQLRKGEHAVLACSALKESYREKLKLDERVKFIYLKGEFELIQHRLALRHNHYMTTALLQSQFATLEEPADALTVNVSLPPHEIVQEIRNFVGPFNRKSRPA
jgi:gluconokinase